LIYVDDVRTAGNSWLEAKLASRQVASVMNWLGLQDAARKWRDPSKSPGPWAGLFVYAEDEVVTVCVSQERWERRSISSIG
jgi:hypothetical protein